MKQLFLTLTLAGATFVASAQTGNLPGVPVFSSPPPAPLTFNYYGTNSPNGNLVAGFGSRYLEYSGGTFTEFVKTNSSGNTGWTVFSTGGGGGGSFSGPGSSVSGNLMSFNGTSGGLGQDSGIPQASLVTNLFAAVFTNGGWYMSNSAGWIFQGTNGIYISSNAQTRVCVTVDTNRVTTWTSNTIVMGTFNPANGSLTIGNGTGGRGNLAATIGTFNSIVGNGGPLVISGGASISGGLEVVDDATFDSDVTLTGGISGDGSGLLNLNPEHFNPPLLGTTNLLASQYAALDSKTNIYPTLNGNQWTNWVAYTHEGTATNITAAFNGTLQSFTVTNGPTVFFHFAGANGSCSYRFTTNVALVFDYQPKWLAGSNAFATNGILSITSYGGTNGNQLEASIKENQ